MSTPLSTDCEQIAYFVGDVLALAQGLSLAYSEP